MFIKNYRELDECCQGTYITMENVVYAQVANILEMYYQNISDALEEGEAPSDETNEIVEEQMLLLCDSIEDTNDGILNMVYHGNFIKNKFRR